MKKSLFVREVAFVQGCFSAMFRFASWPKLLHSSLSTVAALTRACTALTRSESQ